MQRELLVGAALCFAAIHTVQAAPITYDINFTTTFGIAPTSGAFTYDATTTTFSAFTVLWDGFSIDATTAANMAPFVTPAGASCGAPASSEGSFDILSGLSTCPVRQQWVAIGRTGTSLSGVFSFLEYDPAIGGGVDFVATFTTPIYTGNSLPQGNGSFTITATPEPGGILMPALGLLVMGLISPIAVHWSRRGILRI